LYHDSHLTPSAQVPLPFVNDGDRRTVDDIGAERIWVRQPGSGLEKRQASLFLCIGAAGDRQPMPHVIFRGKGTNIFKSAEATKWVRDYYTSEEFKRYFNQ